MAGGYAAISAKAEEFRAAGDLEKALHLIEVAIAAAPEDKIVRTTEGRILVDLIDRTGGRGFDEIGWLESKLSEAIEVVGG
jgi:hypothetical protein